MRKRVCVIYKGRNARAQPRDVRFTPSHQAASRSQLASRIGNARG